MYPLPLIKRVKVTQRHACTGTGGGGNVDPTHSQRRRLKGVAALAPGTAGTSCTGGLVGLGAGVDGTVNVVATGFESPDCPAP